MKRWMGLAGIALLTVLVLLLAPLIGAQPIDLGRAISEVDSMDGRVLWQLRIPRVLAAFVVGSVLAVSGMAFQAMFRNPLATESTLGVSGGAALGAAIAMRIGAGAAISAFAFAGAIGAMLLLFGFTRLRPGASNATLLLAGVAMSFLFSSLVLLLQSTNDLLDSFRLLRWLMGAFGSVGYGAALGVLPFAVLGIAALAWLTHELNLLTTGEDLAVSRGVDVAKTKIWIVVVTSLMVGAAVAICGPVGFIGMIVPHLARLILGHDHARLTPACVLLGGAFLVACDTLARMLMAPTELPVGAITALLGGPFLLWLLWRSPRITA